MGMQEVVNIQRVGRTGRALIIYVPKKVCDVMDIEEGDYIEVIFSRILKKSDKKKIEKKVIKENIEELEELPEI